MTKWSYEEVRDLYSRAEKAEAEVERLRPSGGWEVCDDDGTNRRIIPLSTDGTTLVSDLIRRAEKAEHERDEARAACAAMRADLRKFLGTITTAGLTMWHVQRGDVEWLIRRLDATDAGRPILDALKQAEEALRATESADEYEMVTEFGNRVVEDFDEILADRLRSKANNLRATALASIRKALS